MASASLRDGNVVLTMSVDEALYVTSELAGGNSFFHGVSPSFGVCDDEGFAPDNNPFSVLVDALRVGGTRRGPWAKLYKQHLRVAYASRPADAYDSEAGRKAGVREGLLDPELLTV